MSESRLPTKEKKEKSKNLLIPIWTATNEEILFSLAEKGSGLKTEATKWL